MSHDLGRGRSLDDAPGVIGVTPAEYPPLPDEAAHNPTAGRLDPRRWFPRPADPAAPLEIEIGSGKGTFILEQSKARPAVNFLGIEYAREFYLYTADRLRRAGLKNARMLRTDGGDFLRWRCESAVASVIHLYFSDPWPKKKHHKNRVIQDRFLAEAWRVLVPAGELRVVTDHDDLWAWCSEHFERWTRQEASRQWPVSQWGSATGHSPLATGPLPDPPFDLLPFTPPPGTGEGETVGTNYERKMCGGRPPHSCVLRKRTS